MHERDRKAREISVQRWQARQNMPVPGPAFLLFNASAVSVAGAVVVSTICGLLGDQLVSVPTQNSHQILAYAEVIAAPFLSGLALGILIQRSKRPAKPSLQRAGFALWIWLLAAALVYCISYGMPVSIIIVVLFIYGFFLQLLVFGLALSGVFIAQYIGKPKNAG